MQDPSNFLIYLASASPRRSALLTQIGVRCRIRPVDVDEQLLVDETPERYVERLAALKAETLWAQLREAERAPVLGSDTAVALDGHILGKPRDEADGLRMLELLSGRTHQVYTAVALRHAAGCHTRVNVSDVSFRALTPEERRTYWASGEPADKAGGYAVQGLAAVFIERIAGSYSGIMGLPLYETAELLKTLSPSIYWGCAEQASRDYTAPRASGNSRTRPA
jgi:septum formation protein